MKRVCFLMAILFAVSVFGNFHELDTVSYDFSQNGEYTEIRQQENKAVDYAAERLSPVDSYHKIDDFHVRVFVRSANLNAEETAGGVFFILLAVAAILAACAAIERRRPWFGESKLHIFQVVTFIHQTDGKKKFCFDSLI